MLSHTRTHSTTLSEYLSRACSYSQMDFDYSCSQLVDLLTNPAEVYKTTAIRKQIKNQWARDDPAFMVILCALIVLSSLSWLLAFGCADSWHFIRMVFGTVLIEFIGTGLLLATLTSTLANRFMRMARLYTAEQSVEWLYSWDIHCNAYFPLFCLLSVTQFVLIPVMFTSSFLSTFMGNTLYAIAYSYYIYITFLGYSGNKTV